MLLPTHLVGGAAGYLLAATLLGHPAQPGELLLAVAAANLPDLDKQQSTVGRLFPFISQPVEHWCGHRTITHSLTLQVAAGVVLWWVLPWGWWLALLSGWVSHSILDMATPSGVAWFWPSRARCVFPGNARLRVEVMSPAELGVVVGLGLLSLALAFTASETRGTGGIIDTAIGNIENARKHYDKQRDSRTFVLRLRGVDTDLAAVSGEYPVIAEYRESGLMVELPDGNYRSVCQSGCQINPEYALLIESGRTNYQVQTLVARATTRSALQAALAPISHRRAWLNGELVAGAGKPEPLPPTLEVSGQSMKLNAHPAHRVSELPEGLRDLRVQVVVEGDSAPILRLKAEDKMPDDMSRWLQ